MKKILAIIALAIAATFALAACAPAAEPITVGANTIVIDVRTPAEYSEGHLDGAVNIDVQDANFGTILSQLPTDGDYVVYCHSGNRSAKAVEIMKASGFTHVTDAHGINDASSATGIAIVK
jgi:phage shock protein E